MEQPLTLPNRSERRGLLTAAAVVFWIIPLIVAGGTWLNAQVGASIDFGSMGPQTAAAAALAARIATVAFLGLVATLVIGASCNPRRTP